MSRSYTLKFGRDAGHPGRYVRRVFDVGQIEDDPEWEWETHVVGSSARGRIQIEIQVAREAGRIRKIRLQRVPPGGEAEVKQILELDRDQSMRLVQTLRALDGIDPEGDGTVRLDDDLLSAVFDDPTALERFYSHDPDRMRDLIERDADATDVIALEHRREVAATMRCWLEDPEVFDEAAAAAGGPEAAWQQLLEAEPWVLGIGLSSQLFTSWNRDKLEQAVVGRSVDRVGKRADALLQTAGVVRSLVFAEIKHHQTDLLAGEYRAGCWAPSKELSGAVVQAQQTVHLAANSIGDYLADEGEDGEQLASGAFLIQPRSFLVVGHTEQLTGGSGGPIRDKVRSFELFRRNVNEPEIITFDELVARAEWIVAQHDVEQ